MVIPQLVIDLVKMEAGTTFSNVSKEWVDRSRENALEYIRIYKENKKAYEEVKERKTIFSEWLKQIKEEEYGKSGQKCEEQG